MEFKPKHHYLSWRILNLAIIASFFLLQGCAGDLQGIVRQQNLVVTLHYDETIIGYETLEATLPGGEHFKGRFIGKIASSFGIGFGVSFSGAIATTTTGNRLFNAVDAYNGNIEAVLTGKKGHSTKCRFKLEKPLRGFAGGGAGVCQVSDGRIIDVVF